MRRSLIELQNEIHDVSPAPPASAVRRSLSPPASARSPSKTLQTIDRLLAIQDMRAAPQPGRPGAGSYGVGTGAEDAPQHRPPPPPSPTRSAGGMGNETPKRHAPASATRVSFGSLERPDPFKARTSPLRQASGGGGYAYEPGLIDLVDQLESPARSGMYR